MQECVLALAQKLEERGHTVRVISPRPRNFDGDVPADHILLGTSTDVRSFATTTSFSISGDSDQIEAILEQENFDLLHFHEPWVPILSRQILTKSRCINVATMHAKLPETLATKTITSVVTPYIKSVTKRIDVFTAVSEAAAEYLRTVNGHSKIYIIPNGIDLSKYRSLPSVKGYRKNILYIGRLEKRKGVKYLLDSFALLRANGYKHKLIIAGDGPDRQKLQQYAEQLEIERWVDFVGYISEEQKQQLLGSVELFCSPALYGESFGIVLLEAMAMGTPIIAGDNMGYESVLTERGRLSLVDPRNTVEMQRRMRLFLEDEGLRNLWIEWASEYIKQFDYDKIVDLYERLYLSKYAKIA